MAILAVFLFSYSSLLFTVTYAYSDMRPKSIALYCGGFIIASILAGAAGLLGVLSPELRAYGELAHIMLIIAFAVLASCAFFVLIYVRKKHNSKQKWYVAVLSPAFPAAFHILQGVCYLGTLPARRLWYTVCYVNYHLLGSNV